MYNRKGTEVYTFTPIAIVPRRPRVAYEQSSVLGSACRSRWKALKAQGRTETLGTSSRGTAGARFQNTVAPADFDLPWERMAQFMRYILALGNQGKSRDHRMLIA